MTEPKHTPGPWGVETTTSTLWIGPMREDGRKVSSIVVDLRTGPECSVTYRERQAANAHLIAAAPELLEALESVMERFDPYATPATEKNVAAHDLAVAAIAKATGKAA